MSIEEENLGYKIPDIIWKYDPEEVMSKEGMVYIPRYTMRAGNVSHTISLNYFKTVFERNIADRNEDGSISFSDEALEGLSAISKFTTDETFDRLILYLLGGGRN